MNLLGEADIELQNERWAEITERYSREVDEDYFEAFLNDRKKDIKWNCDIVIMEASYILAGLGDKYGYDSLEDVGIRGENIDELRTRINGKVTNHELKKSKQPESDSDGSINFFTMLAKVKKLGYLIDRNIYLEEWIGVLKDIKQTQ